MNKEGLKEGIYHFNDASKEKNILDTNNKTVLVLEGDADFWHQKLVSIIGLMELINLAGCNGKGDNAVEFFEDNRLAITAIIEIALIIEKEPKRMKDYEQVDLKLVG